MNENLQKFIRDVGVMCEMWMVVFNSFVKLGLAERDALNHTQAFITATLNSNLSKGKETEGETL